MIIFEKQFWLEVSLWSDGYAVKIIKDIKTIINIFKLKKKRSNSSFGLRESKLIPSKP